MHDFQEKIKKSEKNTKKLLTIEKCMI